MRKGLQADATPEEVRDQLSWTRGELAGARRAIQHMCRSMSWIAGHDRQGLDHLEEAMRFARARERAVDQAKRWARRARSAEAGLDRARELHRPVEYGGRVICAECSAYDGRYDTTDNAPVLHSQCSTTIALDRKEP
ncbi:hypothetical protein ABZT17_26870 [Streptomyces sp. NPDC005648]|uniref:hypothetical protein n=1 Tax=Streptomyces sp. NPDC005648 TaxID=3157044 RepID=UPI0033BBC7BB